MADRYQQLTASRPGRFVTKRLGMPQPAPLRRYEPGQPVLDGPALFGAAPGGRLAEPGAAILSAIGASSENGDQRFAALVYDASGIASSDDLRSAYDFFHPVIRRV